MEIDNIVALPFFYKEDVEILEMHRENNNDIAMTIDLQDTNYTVKIPDKYNHVFKKYDTITITKKPFFGGHRFLVEELERLGEKISMYYYNQ